MKRTMTVALVLLAGLVGTVGCGKNTPTSPQAPPERPAYDGGGYMGSGDRVGP